MKQKYKYVLKKRTFRSAMEAMGCETFADVANTLGGVSRQAVSQWYHGARPIPEHHRKKIAQLAGDAVSANDLESRRVAIQGAA